MAVGFSSGSGISFSGVASGLNSSAIVSALLAVESKASRDPLVFKKSTLQSKLDTFGTFETKLQALRDKVKSLDTLSEFLAYKATSSNTDAFSATATGDAIEGSHTIVVSQLAKVETGYQEDSVVYEDYDTEVVGSGTLQITYAGTDYDVTIAADSTLEDVASAINATTALDGKVHASIVNVSGVGYKLLLTGNDTGSGNDITWDSSGLTGGTGLGNFTQVQNAQDAAGTIDSLPFSEDTNSIEGILPGVTINLIGETTGAQLTVAKDIDKVKSNITEFVNAYNDVIDFVRSQQKYEEGKTRKPLFGEATLSSVRSQLPSILFSVENEATPAYATLGLIGVSVQSDGKLKIDNDKLNDALSNNPTAVGDLFVTGYGSTEGVSVQLADFLDGFLDGSGQDQAVLRATKDALGSTITSINAQLLRVDARIDKLADQLNKKYSDLESTMGNLQAQLSFLTQFRF